MADVSFDGRVEHFARRIYGSVKGQLRLNLVWDELAAILPADTRWQVWDAGGGLGQMSALVAAAGHRVLLSDVSGAMLGKAREQLALEARSGQIEIRESALQVLATECSGRFDLVMCHAVLEWLEQPLQAITALCSSVRPGGILSLLVYNEVGLIQARLRRGQWQRVLAGHIAGQAGGRGLTPPSPLRLERVRQQLEQEQCRVISVSGIRCVYDNLPRDVRETMTLDELLQLERRFWHDSDFIPAARYFHILARVEER